MGDVEIGSDLESHTHSHKCQHMIEQESELNSKQPNFAIAKMIVLMIVTIMRKHWIASIFGIIGLVIIYSYYGIWLFLVMMFCAFLAMFYQVSDQLVYWPSLPLDSRTTVHLPSSVGLPYENLFLYAKDGTKLHAVFIKQNSPALSSVPTMLYLHGNAGNMGHRLPNIADLYHHLHINILLLEYRGFGLSNGSPSESGLYMDVQSAINYLNTRVDIDQNKIIIFGRSLGAAVGIDAVSLAENRNRVSALILENTFTSIPNMAKIIFAGVRILPKLPSWCHKNKFCSHLKMCRIITPTLLLSGLSDALVPPRMMTDLYHSCGAPNRKLYQFRGGTHNDTWRCRGYYQVIADFLDEIFQRKKRTRSIPPGVICVSEQQVL